MKPLCSTRELGLAPSRSGKIRDLFDLGDTLLLVATDRLSAYDVVLDDPIPGKGLLLTRMTLEWFRVLDPVPNHFLSGDVADFPPPYCHYPELAGRSMWVAKAQRVNAECIVRGYLSGSGWRDYQRTGRVCGIALPPGLRESARLTPPLFTPSTKTEQGHDENIDRSQLTALVGADVARGVEELSLAVYTRAAEYARQRGILVADTKLEFGFIAGKLALIDEVLSPDSSRFWPAESYADGRPQQSFDKQFVRDWLDASGWDHTPPAPRLPADILERTQERYQEALRRLFPQAVGAVPLGVTR